MTSGEKSFTKTGRMRRATFSQVCQWIITAWSSVKESTITNGFLKAGLLRDAGSTPAVYTGRAFPHAGHPAIPLRVNMESTFLKKKQYFLHVILAHHSQNVIFG